MLNFLLTCKSLLTNLLKSSKNCIGYWIDSKWVDCCCGCCCGCCDWEVGIGSEFEVDENWGICVEIDEGIEVDDNWASCVDAELEIWIWAGIGLDWASCVDAELEIEFEFNWSIWLDIELGILYLMPWTPGGMNWTFWHLLEDSNTFVATVWDFFVCSGMGENGENVNELGFMFWLFLKINLKMEK